MTNPDPNFDQKRRPQGSLFIELKNACYDPVPMELRPAFNHSRRGQNFIDLSRPDGPDSEQPRSAALSRLATGA